MAGSSLLESEDLFNSSYVPNNPSLVLDTALWKTTGGESQPENQEESSPLVHLQPILIEQAPTNNNDENFFLSSEEGLGNCFTLASSVQQDLSEFLLPGQQDLLNNQPPHSNFDNEACHLPPIVSSSQQPQQPPESSQELQDLAFQNLEQLDNLLVNRVDNLQQQKEPSRTEEGEMHASLPPMVRGGANPMEYQNASAAAAGWYIQSMDGRNLSKSAENYTLRKIKTSPSSSPVSHVYENFSNNGIEASSGAELCNSESVSHQFDNSVTNVDGNVGNGGGGSSGVNVVCSNATATSGTWHDTATPGFLSPSAVSAAAAAIGLSPTHLAYNLNHDPYHMQGGWASPSVENPTDLSQTSMGLSAPSPLHTEGCLVDNAGNGQANFMAYQNSYGSYYSGATTAAHEDQLYHAHQGDSQRSSRLALTRSSSATFDAPNAGGGGRLSFSFRTDPQSPSNRSSSDHEIDINSPRMVGDELGFIPLLHPTSPDSSTDTSKNVCNVCGKTYARPSTLKTHMRTHSGERPYRCFECNKSFSQAANLTAHCRTHSGEKPFHCTICNRRFSQSSSVTTHMRTHNGERPYKCRQCRKAFSDSSTLTKHLRIHSGEKPYQCKLCHLRFSQSGNLNRHMRIHEQQQHQQMHHRI